MLKLCRNTFADYGALCIHGFSLPAQWSYIEKLYHYQEKIGIRAGNKLTAKHINFHRHKMKVYLATQTLSTSVATSLELGRENNLSEFKDSEATSHFVKIMDEFDLLNSSSHLADGQKGPITKQNFDSKEKRLKEMEEFLLSLKTKSGKPVYKSRRKTFVIGFVNTIQSIINLSK